MPAKVWVPVAAVIYFLIATVSGGRALAWTWYGLVWVWSLAPFPMTVFMVIFPLLFLFALFYEHDAMPIHGDFKRQRYDTRRRNPAEPEDKTPRQPTPVVREQPKQPEEAPQEPSGPPPDVWREPKPINSGPRQEYTVHKKPPQPKIWGIDP